MTPNNDAPTMMTPMLLTMIMIILTLCAITKTRKRTRLPTLTTPAIMPLLLPTMMLTPPTFLSQIPLLNIKLITSQCLNKQTIRTITDADTATENASHEKINTDTLVPNTSTAPVAVSSTAENKTSASQLIDGGDIINKGFDREAVVDRCVA